jgi:hypothetical protein
MSLLIANVVPEGLIFAADRNLSSNEGYVIETARKLIRWSDPPLLIGYVGEARVKGEPMHDWLHGFLEQHATDDLHHLAHRLADALEAEFKGLPKSERGTILHVGAFEDTSSGPLPAMWYIRDAEIQLDGSVRHLDRFTPRDELKRDADGPAYFGDARGEEIRNQLRLSGSPVPWAGFRQSFDLAVFGQLDAHLWAFAGALTAGGVAREMQHARPRTLEEWVPFMRFSVLGFAAYFDAFYPPGKQLVGGALMSNPSPGRIEAPSHAVAIVN